MKHTSPAKSNPDLKELWLSRALNIDAEIAELQEAKQRAYQSATAVTVQYTGVGKKKQADPHKIEQYLHYSVALDNAVLRSFETRSAILEVVNTLEDPSLRSLLIAKYINGKTWDQIAESIDYTVRHAQRLHKKAMELIVIPTENN